MQCNNIKVNIWLNPNFVTKAMCHLSPLSNSSSCLLCVQFMQIQVYLVRTKGFRFNNQLLCLWF